MFCHYLRVVFRKKSFGLTNIDLFRKMAVEETNISLDTAKRLAACAAIDNCINESTKVVGIGSGSTIVYAIEHLAKRIWNEDGLCDIVCIPTSFQSRQLILKYKLNVGELDRYPKLDITVDGADEVDSSLVLIKGGGACLLQEKIVASCSNNLVIIADYTKKSLRLGEQWCRGVPIEVVPVAYLPVIRKVRTLYDGELELRMAKMKAGPIVTDNGNFILDWHFVSRREYNWDEVNHGIKMIPGVVETGLFVNMATKAYFGMADGTVKMQVKP